MLTCLCQWLPKWTRMYTEAHEGWDSFVLCELWLFTTLAISTRCSMGQRSRYEIPSEMGFLKEGKKLANSGCH